MGINQFEMTSVEELRQELTAYCYRMLGSIFDADDAVQDTLVRAWQSWDQFRQESSLRTWIYRIATNVCLDKLRGAKRRALPMDVSDPFVTIVVPQDTLPHVSWIWPTPDIANDPADLTIRKHTIRLAFIAALQILPPRQRAVLVLNDVFKWTANETAKAIGMTVAAVNSALQRARSKLNAANLTSNVLREQDTVENRQLLDRYVDAFERYDVDTLITLFQEDGSLSMPPFAMWVRGRNHLASFYAATRNHCFGSRLLPVSVNGTAAFAQYVPTASADMLEPWGIHVLEIIHGQIAHIYTFIDSALFSRLGLPLRLEMQSVASS